MKQIKQIIKRTLSALLGLVLCVSSFTAGASPTETEVSAEVSQATELPHFKNSMVYLPDGVRAVSVTPGVDFALTDGELTDELSKLYGEIANYGMNAVIIESPSDSTAGDVESVLKAACEGARSANLYTWLTLDANALLSDVREHGGGLKNGFAAAVHKFVMKYPCDGILLSDYYTADTDEMYAEYMRSGSGIGYKNWLYETSEYIFRTLSEVVRATNNFTAVGMLAADMWANYTTNELGSVTADTVEALYDGFCDTKGYIEKGYVDFVLVRAYGTTDDQSLNFKNVVEWWYTLAESAGIKLYVQHLNERIGQKAGWGVDQLLQQLAVMEDYGNLGGSAFHSFSSLRADPLGSTDTLLKYFDNEINPETVFDDLEIISPTELSYVTYDTSVKFMGTFDENFDVLFNGEKLVLNEAGNFFVQKELEVGMNSFTIEHKDKVYNYSINRKVDVLRSIEQENDIKVEGGTKLTLRAVAYSGAVVSASVGGNIINLKEKVGNEELDANGSYSVYVGYYTVADGIIGEEQALGNISFYAAFKGEEEYMEGGAVTIEAKPEPPKPIAAEIVVNQSSTGSGEVVGTIEPVVTDAETVTYVRTINNYTIVYDALTTGDIQSPIFSQLPAGSLDYYKSAYGNYITTTSGRRFKTSDVTTFTDTGLGYNALEVKAIGNTGGKSFIKLHLRYKSTFNVTAPTAFHDDPDGAYGVSSFDASEVYITFDNITSVTGLPSFEYCSLFSAGKWETVEENGVPKFRLVLTLRQAGVYSGCGAYYDENGDLMLTFGVPTASLSGKVIVIDPGHGYGKVPGVLDPGAVGFVTEQSVNEAVSKLLEEKLTAMGATVVRLKTESEFTLTAERPVVARQYGADMYLSLHCNYYDTPDPHGVEVYYFTPFSEPLATAINNNLVAFYDSVYADGTQSNRGSKYSYYWVTLQQDFPSVLVEMGFVTNERECMIMANADYQSQIADAIANGVYSYFAGSGLSYSGSGSAETPVPSVPDPAETETPEPSGGSAETEQPETEQPETETVPQIPIEPEIPTETEEPTVPPVAPTEPESGETSETTLPEIPGWDWGDWGDIGGEIPVE